MPQNEYFSIYPWAKFKRSKLDHFTFFQFQDRFIIVKAVVSNIFFRVLFISFSYSGTYYKVVQLSLCILLRHRFYVERVLWGGVKFLSSLSFVILMQWMQCGEWEKVKRTRQKDYGILCWRLLKCGNDQFQVCHTSFNICNTG